MLAAESKYPVDVERLVKKHRDRLAFLLEGFVWSTNHDSSTDMLNASDRLSSLIVTYTHVPLRDLSMAVVTLLTRRK